MNLPLSSRSSGWTAIVASAVGLLVLPPITLAYARSEAGAGTDPAWSAAASGVLDPLISFADADTVYSTYGKVYFLVVLGLLVGTLGLLAVRQGTTSRLEQWGLRLSVVGLVLLLVGLATDYTLFEGTVVENVGFAAGSLLGLLLLVVGSVLAGVAWLRRPGTPRWGAWLALAAVPGIVLLGLLGFGNLPSMPIAWFCIVWLALGGFLAGQGSRATTGSPSRP